MEKDSRLTFFDWHLLTDGLDHDIPKIKSRIKHMMLKTKGWERFAGKSFLLNPEPLFFDTTVSDLEIVEYVGIASLRNYFDAKYLGRFTLPIYFCDVPIQRLKSNRLLQLDKDLIKFKYEEKYGT